MDTSQKVNSVFFSAKEDSKLSSVGNLGLQFRVGDDLTDAWANPICYEALTDINSLWFYCGLTGKRFCVTRDKALPDIIEIGEIEAYSEYFVQHLYH